jgi:DNA-binding NtrC family response regulator
MALVLVMAEEQTARRLRWILSEAGYGTRQTSDAADGVRQAEAERPAVIVVNGIVPRQQLPSLVRQLKERAPDSGVLDITHMRGAQELATNAEAHLIRPFDADDFLEAVAKAQQRGAADG